MCAHFLKDNTFLSLANEVNAICEPLQLLGVDMFSYMKNYFNGKQVYLSNNADWIDDYYNLELFKSSLFECKPSEYQSGYAVWPEESPLEVFTHAKEYFHSYKGITVVEKLDNAVEFFFFSSTKDHQGKQNFYINNVDLLKRFIMYFKDKGNAILDEAEQHKVAIMHHQNEKTKIAKELKNISALIDPACVLRNEFMRATEIKHSALNLKDLRIKLSKREVDCITWLLNGKSAQETADKLFLSRRTVETHLNNIKDKFQCGTKSELIVKLLQQNFGYALCDLG